MAEQKLSLKQYIDAPATNVALEKLLGKNLQVFKSNLLNIASDNRMLKNCKPQSIVAAAVRATTLNLSIVPSLREAYIVPYGEEAQFQIGVKGLIQLVHRSGKCVKLHAGKVLEGQVKEIDFLTGDIIRGEKISDTVVGYIAYMKLTNGFEKSVYMTVDEITRHAKKFSRGFGKSSSPWTTDFDSMARKTVLKKLLKSYGYLSANVSAAIQSDDDDAMIQIDDDQTRNAEVIDITDSVVEEGDAPSDEPPQETVKAEPTADPF